MEQIEQIEQIELVLRRKRGRPCKNEPAINLAHNNSYMKMYNNDYYHNHVKKVIIPASYMCECGKSIAESYKTKHKLTSYHIRHHFIELVKNL